MTDTSDRDDRDDRDLLVQSYLDGDLDAAGRAAVESEPALVAEIAAQEEIRAVLRQPDPPDAASRDRAIAAALAEFDERQAAGDRGPIAPPVASLATRRRARWLAPAAAAVAIAVAGAVVVLAGGGSDEDAGDERAVVTAAARDGSAALEAPAATVGAAEETMAILDAAESADTAFAAGAEIAADAAAPASGTLPLLRSADDLAAFAAGARAATTGGGSQATVAAETESAASAVTGCSADVIALAELDLGDGPVPVAVRIDEVTVEAIALDTVTCVELLRAPLP